MLIALFRRYKLFFFIGFAILAIQLFLAYKSIKIPIESHLVSDKVSNLKAKIVSAKQTQLTKDDDEDIINSNIPDVVHKDEKASTLSELEFKPKCDILHDKEVLSAVQRAHSQKCKETIINVACEIKSNSLYPSKLPNSCPSGNYIANRSLGCYQDEKKQRLLPSFYTNFKETNSPKKCIQMCLQSGCE